MLNRMMGSEIDFVVRGIIGTEGSRAACCKRTLSKYFARSVPVEFMVEEDTSKVIKIVPTGGIEIVRFGEMKGYFQIVFQATTSYWMTPMEVRTFNLSAGNSFTVIYPKFPKIYLPNH